MKMFKDLFAKIKPETAFNKALTKTVSLVLIVILGFTIMVINPPIFTLIIAFALISFFIYQIFDYFHSVEKKKSRGW